MNIRPSASIRHDYNGIAELCKSSGEPVYLTKNGQGDLIVMDLAAYERREKMLTLRERLLNVERGRINGVRDYSIDELNDDLGRIISEAGNGSGEI